MSLSKLEREVITDSRLKVQSIQASLEQIAKDTIPDSEEIDNCLEATDNSLREALQNGSKPESKP